MAVRRAMERLLAVRQRDLAVLARGLSWLSPVRRLMRLEDAFDGMQMRLGRAAETWTGGLSRTMDGFLQRFSRRFGPESLDGRQEAVARRAEHLETVLKFYIASQENRLELAAARLTGLDPKGPLARGYSLAVVSRTGKFLRREGDVRPGDNLDIMVYEGHVRATVTDGSSEGGESA